MNTRKADLKHIKSYFLKYGIFPGKESQIPFFLRKCKGEDTAFSLSAFYVNVPFVFMNKLFTDQKSKATSRFFFRTLCFMLL